jgi:hypothetical protein
MITMTLGRREHQSRAEREVASPVSRAEREAASPFAAEFEALPIGTLRVVWMLMHFVRYYYLRLPLLFYRLGRPGLDQCRVRPNEGERVFLLLLCLCVAARRSQSVSRIDVVNRVIRVIRMSLVCPAVS